MQSRDLSAAVLEERIDGPADWTIERNDHLLILHEAGSYHRLETWLDGRRTSLGDPLPGEMWFIPSGRRYRGAARGGGVRYVEVRIPWGALAVAPTVRPIAGHRDRAMATLAHALAEGETGAQQPLLLMLQQMLDGAPADMPDNATARRIDALLPFIETHIETSLTVEQLAVQAGMSANSLIVHFARATGRTPRQYLLHQRLRRACWYLANLPISVAEIAFATGFSSHAHLCATFRTRIGQSPGEWRRHHAATPLPA